MDYWIAWDPNAPEFILGIAQWCSTCHTRYLAPLGSGHTNSGDAVFKYRHNSDLKVKGVPNCIQCHVSHGSNAIMNGVYTSQVPTPAGAPGNGNSRLLRIDERGICQMCHNNVMGGGAVPGSCAACHRAHYAKGAKLLK